jgi:hypothetical protein
MNPLSRRILNTFFVWLVLAAPAAATDLTGQWSLDLQPDFSGNDDNVGCSFLQKDERLTLNCGAGPDITGEVHGGMVTWLIKVGRSREFTATFTGELDRKETTISGTWRLTDDTGIRQGKFTATKISGAK